MGACDKINQDQTFNCGDDVSPGNQPIVRLLNVDDLASLTRDPANDRLITGITQVGTTKAFRFTAPKDAAVKSSNSSESGTYSSKVTQTITFPVLVVTPDDKLNMQKAINSKVYAIVEKIRKGADGSNKYHLYGDNGGGELSFEEADDSAGDDNASLYIVTFTATNQKVPATIFSTDEGTTDTAITALETAV